MSDETVLTVGSDKQFQTINAAILAADQMGGNADIKVDAGTYTNDGGYLWDGIDNVTIEGVGGMAKIVDPAFYAGGKAAIVTGGQNVVLKNLDISGITVPDGNGAGIRYDQGTLLIDNVHLHNNQNGILGAADATGSITIQNSEIDHNGTSAGNTHNIYIGDIANFTLTNSYVHDANVGHEVKSRAENNTITNNRIEDNNGTSSYAIDLPNGGNATITGNVIEQGINNQNHTINAYGEEGNLHTGNAVTFSNNTVVNDDAEGRGPLWANNGATITGTGNTAWNTSDLGNGISPASFTALSARPTLDTSSTNSSPISAEAPQTARDAAPPVVTVSQSISGITTSTSNTLSGTVSDAGSGVAAVEIFLNSAGRSIDIGAATLNGSNWSYTVSNLTPGTYNFYAVGFDKAGNTTAPISTGPAETVVDAISSQQPTSTPTEAPQTARDAAPPVVTVSQSISGITTSTSNTLSGTVSDAGSGVAAVEIFLNSAGRSIDIGAATLNGSNWSYTVSNLTPGTYNFYAVGFDKAGNTTAPISTGPAETVVDAISSQQPTSTPATYPAQTVLTVGSDKQFQTINAAILAADQMGGNADIKVDAGTYTNDGGYLWDGIDNVTIEGVGGMAKIVDPAFYAGGKAAIVTGGQNVVLKNLDISGITVPDGNGAGIRYDQGTLLIDNVHLHNNQNGILGAADATGSITIQNSEIDHNGTSAGNTHNIYIGDIANFTLTNSYVHDANVGHEVKSRAENNTITNNRIEDNNGTSSYAIDLPNGGNATITGNVIEQGINNQNHTINAYGEEGNLHTGNAVTFSNNTVVNDDAEGRGPLWANNGATITGTGNTAWNTSDLGNGISPASFTALSARPTLDTSSTGRLEPLITAITSNQESDTITGSFGVTDVFAVTSSTGNEIINGFESASANGSVYDYINFSDADFTSFSQVAFLLSGTSSAIMTFGSGKTVTLSDVAASSFAAADFRFS